MIAKTKFLMQQDFAPGWEQSSAQNGEGRGCNLSHLVFHDDGLIIPQQLECDATPWVPPGGRPSEKRQLVKS